MPLIRFTVYLGPSVSRDFRNISLYVNEIRMNKSTLQRTELSGERRITVTTYFAIYVETGHMMLRRRINQRLFPAAWREIYVHIPLIKIFNGDE